MVLTGIVPSDAMSPPKYPSSNRSFMIPLILTSTGRFIPQRIFAFLALFLACNAPLLVAQEPSDRGMVHTFNRQSLTKTYFSEGAGVGDLNADSKPDVVYGPYWFEGPEFKVSHEIYAPKPQPTVSTSLNPSPLKS